MSVLSSARRRSILEIVSKKRVVTITELAEAFSVSSVTLRRDLDRLADEDLIERVHGGAMARSAIAVAPPASRQHWQLSDAQHAIGREASSRIRDGDYIILESGSTCLAVVPHLRVRANLRVLTASLRLASALAALAESENLAIEIICCGGTLNARKDFFLGPHARALFESCRVDLALLSVTAIDLDAGVTADSFAEAEISRTILEKCAKRTIGLITSGKLERMSFARVAGAQALDEIITDSGADAQVLERYRNEGIEVTVV